MTRTLPLRRPELVVRSVAGEAVVLNPRTDTAVSLTPVASRVFLACDGATTVAALEAELGDDVVDAALADLMASDLLVVSGASRRIFLQRVGLVGAGAVAASIAVPAAAMAVSGRGGTPGSSGNASIGAIVYPVPNTFGGDSYTQSQGFGNAPSPTAEQVGNAVDGNVSTKYLNFNGAGSGLTIKPLAGFNPVTSVNFVAANDSIERDPVTISVLGGTVDNSGAFSATTTLYTGASPIATDPGRNTAGTPVTFPNTTSYQAYQVLFATLRGPDDNPPTSHYAQVAEVQLFA